MPWYMPGKVDRRRCKSVVRLFVEFSYLQNFQKIMKIKIQKKSVRTLYKFLFHELHKLIYKPVFFRPDHCIHRFFRL